MAQFILPTGGIVLVDDEDLCVLEDSPWAWLQWRYRKEQSWMVARDEWANGCRYRALLHRLIALRIEPRMADDPARYTVSAINKDLMDVRRENLHIAFRTRGSGRVPYNRKPTGAPAASQYRDTGKPHSALWSGGIIWKRSGSEATRRHDDSRKPYSIAARQFLTDYRAPPPRRHEPGSDPMD